MKSIRLNNSIRYTILDAIENQYVAANPKPEVVSVDVIPNAVDKFFLRKLKELQDKVDKSGVPEEHFIKVFHQYYVDLEGGTLPVQANYGSDSKGQKLSVKRLQVNPDSNTIVDLRNTKEKELLEAIALHKKNRKAERPKRIAQSQWDTAKKAYMAEINSVVFGVNSTKQLLEVWPEVEEYLPKSLVNPSSIKLPSFNIDKLNAGLGK